MQQSNTYVLVFTGVMALVLGGVLSLTSVSLKPLQMIQEELDTKKKILAAVMDISAIKGNADTISALYAERVHSLVIDAGGEPQNKNAAGMVLLAERISIRKNHKISPQDRYYPVFLYKKDPNSTTPTAYIIPMFGAGLWDWISGYIALDSDFSTVRGVTFDHKTETPGLGARITSAEVQQRFKGKQIFDKTGTLQSVTMLKGEAGKPLDLHHVDGMSGATMTSKGVNVMLKEYLTYYLPYIQRVKVDSIPQKTHDELAY